jgi:hypothetical protein
VNVSIDEHLISRHPSGPSPVQASYDRSVRCVPHRSDKGRWSRRALVRGSRFWLNALPGFESIRHVSVLTVVALDRQSKFICEHREELRAVEVAEDLGE